MVQFVGQISNFSTFQRMLKIQWRKFGDFSNISAGSNLFVVQTASVDVRDQILEGGPWYVHGQPLIVRKWEPRMSSLDFKLDSIPVWIHLSNIPLEMFNQKGIGYLASAVGTPLFMDKFTAKKQRLAFARVRVEVDAMK